MTVAELKEALKELDDDLEVRYETLYGNGPVASVCVYKGRKGSSVSLPCHEETFVLMKRK